MRLPPRLLDILLCANGVVRLTYRDQKRLKQDARSRAPGPPKAGEFAVLPCRSCVGFCSGRSARASRHSIVRYSHEVAISSVARPP